MKPPCNFYASFFTSFSAWFFLSAALIVSPFIMAQPSTDTHPVDISGVWMPTTFNPAGNEVPRYNSTVPYLPAYQAALEAYEANYHAEIDDPSRSCLPTGVPAQMMLRAQYPIEIIQTEGRLTILAELHNDVRRVYMDGRVKPQGTLPTWMGYSTGYWHDDVLIIETSSIREKGFPTPQSSELKVTEKIRVVNGGDIGSMLEVTITIDDPLVHSKPFTATNHFRQFPGLEMGEYFCSDDLWRQNLDEDAGEIPWR